MTFTRRLRRRVMIALYGAMILPLLGFGILDGLALAPAGWDAQRLKLAIVLTGSIGALAVLVVYVDRTVIRPLERRALEFAACLGHELRTPLAAVRGAAELLEDAELDADVRLRFARNIVQESDRLERLATGVLDLERLEHGAVVHPEIGDAAEILDTFAERAAPLMSRKSLTLEVASVGHVDVVASADRVHRVLIGLLENAIRHSPRGGCIRIAATTRDEVVVFTVDDDGDGVPVSAREHIFSRRHTTDRGYGLGLAIVDGLVRSVGGCVNVADAPGGGARFVVQLPRPVTHGRVVGVQPRSSARPAQGW